MTDPLAEVVSLLQPSARFSKLVEAAGQWRILREDSGSPFYCAVLEGQCRISIDDAPPVLLQAGDFVLAPAVRRLVNTSIDAPADAAFTPPVQIGDGHFRVGRPDGPAELRARIGHCSFGSPDAALLVSLLPSWVHVRGEPRLATLVQLVGEESRARRPAREMVLERLLEVLLIEALRCGAGAEASPGLMRGLADERLAGALRSLHADPAEAWNVERLARQAALSRSAFFARFQRTLGVAPMEYLLAWRMALAKKMLQTRETSLAQIAERIGYGSASAFSVAFARHVGMPPARYARGLDAVGR